MKEKILWFLNVFLLVLTVAIIIYNVGFAENPNYGRIAKGLGIVVVYLISSFSTLSKERKNVYRTNREAYGHILGDVFEQDPKKYKRLMRGIELYNKDRLEAAIRMLTSLLEECETNKEKAVVAHFLGNCNMEAGYLNMATENFEQAVECDPTLSDARNNLGVCYKSAGDMKRAIATFEEVLIYKPKEEYALVNLAQCYEALADWQKALMYAQEALKINNTFLEALATAWFACERMGDSHNAGRYREMFLVNGGKEKELNEWGGDLSAPPSAKTDKEGEKIFDHAMAAKVAEMIREESATGAYRIVLEAGETYLSDSKVGGLPYWDPAKAYPLDSEGNPLSLLAQINFEKEALHDARLPDRGILQFFIADAVAGTEGSAEMYGIDFEHPDEQKDFRVVYHEWINRNVTEEDVRQLGVRVMPNGGEWCPVLEEAEIHLEPFTDCVDLFSLDAYDYEKVAVKECLDEEWGESGLSDYFSEEDMGYIIEELDTTGHKLLGRPDFCQDDPRGAMPEDDRYYYDTLLFQLASEDECVMWGDGGIANFFINSKALEEHNFSQILYNWDCF